MTVLVYANCCRHPVGKCPIHHNRADFQPPNRTYASRNTAAAIDKRLSAEKHVRLEDVLKSATDTTFSYVLPLPRPILALNNGFRPALKCYRPRNPKFCCMHRERTRPVSYSKFKPSTPLINLLSHVSSGISNRHCTLHVCGVARW